MLMYFLQHSNYRPSTTVKFATTPFFVPLPAPSGRPPDWDWGQPLAFHPQPTHQQWECCTRWPKSWGNHHGDWLGLSGSLLLHLPVKQFDHSAGRLPESSRSLWRVAWTVLSDTAWAWASLMTVPRWSFSTLAAISAMDTFAVRFLWSATAAALSPTFWWSLIAAFSSRPCHGRPFWQFPGSSEVFSCSGERWRRMGGGKERKMNGVLVWKGEKAEIKDFPNRECYQKYFIKKALRPMWRWIFRSSGY